MTTDALSAGLGGQLNPALLGGNNGVNNAKPAALPATPSKADGAVSDDSVNLTPEAAALAKFQDMVDRLNRAASSGEKTAVLGELKDFIQQNTGSEMADDVLDQLVDVVNKLGQSGQSFQFSFHAQYQQHEISSQDYYKNVNSFSISFSIQTADSVMSGKASFGYFNEQSADGARFAQYEEVHLGLVSFAADIMADPLVQAFNDLTQKITGFDVGAMMKEITDRVKEATQNLPEQNYRAITTLEKFQMQFSALNKSCDDCTQILEGLRKALVDQIRDGQKDNLLKFNVPEMPAPPEEDPITASLAA